MGLRVTHTRHYCPSCLTDLLRSQIGEPCWILTSKSYDIALSTTLPRVISLSTINKLMGNNRLVSLLVHDKARHAGFEPEYVTCEIDASPSQYTVLLM